LEYGNDALLALEHQHPDRIRGYVTVNPNYTAHAQAEIARCLGAGMVGIKLAASRRATDPLLDSICELARERGVPILHHVWQHRRRDWPGQEATDGAELARLAARHPGVRFILAHIGGGGDWQHSLAALRSVPNVLVDLSGSGVDGGMLEACIEAVGPERLLWGTDLTMDTGWAKLRLLTHLLPPAALELVKWKNAASIFPRAAFPTD
jgi:predicted TIM-barrel fold metal-dependent hydrolase